MTAATYSNETVITLLATENPKKGASADRFAVYKTGMTVAEYKAAAGKRAMADLRWDLARNYISLATPVPTESETPAPTESKAPAKQKARQKEDA